MRKESLDYSILCPNYYSSWEDGCCMESCEFYHRDECPIVYVNGLLSEKDEEIKILKEALYLATEQISELQFGCEEFNMCQLCSNWYTDAENCAEIECEEGYVNYFLNKAKEMLKDENKETC